MYDRENANNRTLQYFITKLNENGKFYLECITGCDPEWAKKVLAECQAKEPTATFRIETEEARNCWWCYGTN